jgi:hydroxyethylthiazole kinase-like uncharacterized protein yjeF
MVRELLTSAQMRAIEQAAIASGKVTGLELMERAGRGVFEAIFEEWPKLAQAPNKAVVLCGPGNNGGDGFVVARLLKDWGWEVEVFLYGDAAKLPPDAKANYARWAKMGEARSFKELTDQPWKADLNIDALFGTGLTRPLEGVIADLAGKMRKSAPPGHDVAIDAPSGLCMDSGKSLGAAFVAELTVSFHTAKVGHFLNDGPEFSQHVVVKDIGLQKTGPVQGGGVSLVMPPSPTSLGKSAPHHKYSHGHALILSGGAGKTGAARLAARGALRIGAGLVTLGVPPVAQQEVAGHITALMLRRVADADALRDALNDRRITALCLGPGLGLGRARDLVPVAVRHECAPYAVLDADALTAFEGAPGVLFDMLHEGCVLTPHGGEFARLFPDIAEKLAAPATRGPVFSKVDATRAAAQRAGCVVLYKGPDTVIAAPDGRCSISSAHYDRSAPWLATAGSGDVLAGFITGLLARGLDPMQAAEVGAWLHVAAARAFGPGLIAEDLPEVLPQVMRDLGL